MRETISVVLSASIAGLTIWLTIQIVNRRKSAAICAAAALLVLITGFAVNLLRIPQRWSKLDLAKLDSLHKGMPQPEVEQILGGPPGNYGNPENNEAMMTLEGFWPPPGSVEKEWSDDFHRFQLLFDASGHLVAWHKRAAFSRTYRYPPWRLKVRQLTGL